MATPDSLSQEEILQPIYNLHGLILQFQNSYFLAKEGTLDLRIQKSLTEVIKGGKDQPGLLFYWKARKSIFFEEFQVYVDDILQSTDTVSEGVYKEIESAK